ncbi:MAG: hypothetical protein H0U73_03500 [Tatlockia sp.]|nr:hypothetical protein [Tatlockia sp.]
MKRKWVSKTLIIALGILYMATSSAREPLFSFFPYTSTTVIASQNSVNTVRYLVTNESKKSFFTLFMTSYGNPGIVQDLSPGNCSSPFILGPQQSCFLQLSIIGSALTGNVEGGPEVCTLGLPLQCYSSVTYPLRVIKTPQANSFTVGGVVSGLEGTLVLTNNGTNQLIRTADGSFTFSEALPSGSPYAVTVLSKPSNQNCVVNNGIGVIQNQAIINVEVVCTPAANLTSTVMEALVVNGMTRTLLVVNNGSATATGLMTNTPVWPAGTSSNSTCSGDLAPGDSCTIAVDPGPNPTLDVDGNPCNLGTAPVPGLLQVTSTNANTITSNVVVLDFGCIYKGGFVFSVDDSTPSTTSVAGKVAALADEVSQLIWDTVGGNTLALSLTNGLSNTETLSFPNGQFPAAQSCYNKVDQGFSNWYLPAACQVGSSSNGLICPATANLSQNLQDNGVGNFINLGLYWSSTQNLGAAPAFHAWRFNITGNSANSAPTGLDFLVRCVRDFE